MDTVSQERGVLRGALVGIPVPSDRPVLSCYTFDF